MGMYSDPSCASPPQAPPVLPPPPTPPQPPQPPAWPSYDSILNPDASSRTYSSEAGVGMLNGSPSWSPYSCVGDGSCWMQMDLGTERRVSGVVTQDDTWFGRYVKTFSVQACAQADVSADGMACIAWSDVDGGATFQGPSHGCSPPIHDCAGNGLTGMLVPVDALFDNQIEARLIRILPLTEHRQFYMRAAVLVVEFPPLSPPPPSPQPQPPAPPSPPPPPFTPLLTLGTVILPLSAPHELHRLVRVRMANADARTGHWPAPAARSYDGEPWEALYPPAGVGRIEVNCSLTACALVLPHEVASGWSYRVDVYNASLEGPDSISSSRLNLQKAAKMLTQATFGPKREEIDALAAQLADGSEQQVFGEWVEEQIAMPASSHRGYFRERLNSRTHATGRLACEPLSRWHRYSLTTLDVAARVNVTITVDAVGVRSFFVQNLLRTQIRDFSEFDPDNVLNVTVNHAWHGYLCRVGERVGGFFTTRWGWHHRGGIGLDTASTCIRNAANHLQFAHPQDMA